MAFSPIELKDLNLNPFEKIGHEWALLTAGDEQGFNTMTISWGGMGVLWNRDVVTAYVRPQRYTKRFLDEAGRFTLSFYAPEHKRALGVLGTKSGRDTDKVTEVGFTPLHLDGTCAFEQADLIFVCRTLYTDELEPACFLDRSCDTDNYPEHDYHTMYIAQIEGAYQRV